MLTIPRELNTKEIQFFIDDVICYHDVDDFYSLDDIDQDKFTALCIRAFGCDIEIVIGSDANNHLCKYLFTNNNYDAFDLLNKVKESAREKFSSYFDELLREEKLSRQHESLIESGKRQIVDRINGEVRYI